MRLGAACGLAGECLGLPKLALLEDFRSLSVRREGGFDGSFQLMRKLRNGAGKLGVVGEISELFGI